MSPPRELAALAAELVALAPWWSGWTRPLAEAELASFEAEHGVTLPPGYRGVLREIGDQAPLPTRPDRVLAPLRGARSMTTASSFLGPLAEPFPHTGTDAVELEWDDEADDYADPLWLRGCLPLAGAGCDESIVLVVSGPDRGRVWGVTPSAAPELHPTGLEFSSWYRAELERAVERERGRVAEQAELERRVADPDDLEAAVALGRALLLVDRDRARVLLERAWSQAHYEPDAALARAIAELDLLDDRRDRLDSLTERCPPWCRCYAAIAAARGDDHRRAVELFEGGARPAILGALVAGWHAHALAQLGRPRDALELLRRSPTNAATLALAATLHTELGEHDEARRCWTRLRDSPVPKPRAPTLADFVGLPPPSPATIDAALADSSP